MILWASNTTPDVWGEKFENTPYLSEIVNLSKREKQPTSKEENLRTEEDFDRVVELDLLT